MDLTAFYATVSGLGFTLLGLWLVVADRHPEWFRDDRGRAAYVIALHFMVPATMSLLSLVAPGDSAVWRTVFALLGLSGLAGAVLVARSLREQVLVVRGALLVAAPVYGAVVLVALAPEVSDLVDLAPLQVEAFLLTLVVLLGLHAAWFLGYAGGSTGERTDG